MFSKVEGTISRGRLKKMCRDNVRDDCERKRLTIVEARKKVGDEICPGFQSVQQHRHGIKSSKSKPNDYCVVVTGDLSAVLNITLAAILTPSWPSGRHLGYLQATNVIFYLAAYYQK